MKAFGQVALESRPPQAATDLLKATPSALRLCQVGLLLRERNGAKLKCKKVKQFNNIKKTRFKHAMALQNIAIFFFSVNTVLISTNHNKSSVFTCTVYWRKCTKCDAPTGRSVLRWKKCPVPYALKASQVSLKGGSTISALRRLDASSHDGSQEHNVPMMSQWHHPSTSFTTDWDGEIVCLSSAESVKYTGWDLK